jgi:hypothetical protein
MSRQKQNKITNWNQVQTWKIENRKLRLFFKRTEIPISCMKWNLYVLWPPFHIPKEPWLLPMQGYTHTSTRLVGQNLFFLNLGKSMVNLWIIRCNCFRPIGAALNQMSSDNIHFDVECRNKGCGAGLPGGRSMGRCLAISMNMSITSEIG